MEGSLRTLSKISAILTVAALTLTACGPGDQAQTASPLSKNDNPRDVSLWSPSFTPKSNPVTVAEENRSRLEQVNQILKAGDIPPLTDSSELPDVIRVISQYESSELWSQCLTQQGFPSSAEGGTVSTSSLPPEQNEIYLKTYADCVAQYPINAKYLQVWGEDQWKVMYEYLVDYYIPCVESFGIAIDKETIPKERTFIEDGLSGKDLWHPVFDWTVNPDYADLANTGTDKGNELGLACRQSPPSEKLFGS